MDKTLSTYPSILQQIVDWGDMDAYQHVNNTVFFRYFENARIAFFNQIEWLDIQAGSGVGPIVASTACRFRRPLTYPDTLQSAIRIGDLQESGFIMQHLIWSEKLQSIAAEGESRIVSYDYANSCKTPLPSFVRDAILDLQKNLPR